MPSLIQWVENRLTQLLILLAGFATVSVAYAGVTFGAPVGIKGTYAIAGICIAIMVYTFSSTRAKTLNIEQLQRISLWKLTLSAVISAVALAHLTQNRVGPLLIALLVGYCAVGIQLYDEAPPRSLLIQSGCLLVASPVIKYVTSGFYFGNVDTLKHVGWVERLIRYGRTSQMTDTWYQNFPSLHILSGTVSQIAGLLPYDALYLTGIASYFVVPTVLYLLAKEVSSDERLSLTIAVVSSVVYHLPFYASYFYPQAMATVLVLFALYLFYRLHYASGRNQLAVLGLFAVVCLGTLFTHHLTLLLFAPPLAILSVGSYLSGRTTGASISRQELGGVGLAVGGTIIYLITAGRTFLEAVLNIGLALLTQSGKAGRTSDRLYVFGDTKVAEETIPSAISWLFGANGIYFSALLAIFVLGCMWIVENRREQRSLLPVFTVGIFGSVLILQTPIVIKSKLRIGFPWAFFFAFVIGFSLYQMTREKISIGRIAPVGLVLLVILGSFAPLVMGGYYIENQQSSQQSFSTTEYSQLEVTSEFVDQRSTSVSTVWLTRRSFNHFGTQSKIATVDNCGFTYQDGLVYRQAWSKHTVNVRNPSRSINYFDKVRMSSEWISKSVTQKNEIYSTGEIGIVTGQESSTFGTGC